MSHQVDVAGFHNEAKRLLAQQVPPEDVEWAAASARSAGTGEVADDERATMGSRAARAIIPQSFVRMSELVVMHRDPSRFDLLYRSLWRLVYEPHLKHDFSDGDLARLRQMAQAVRRDIQKMKSRLAFHTVMVKGKPVRVAWYEPGHFICEAVGGWLAKSDPASAWVLFTPDRSVHWDGGRLMASAGLPAEQQPQALSPEGWQRVVAAQPWF